MNSIAKVERAPATERSAVDIEDNGDDGFNGGDFDSSRPRAENALDKGMICAIDALVKLLPRRQALMDRTTSKCNNDVGQRRVVLIASDCTEFRSKHL